MVLDAGNQIQIPTTQNCDSTNGIYCIVCSKCNKLYVGETRLSFRKRINIHRLDVQLKKDTAVATHFNSGSCRATHLRVLYLEVLKNTGDITRPPGNTCSCFLNSRIFRGVKPIFRQ